MNEEDYTMRIAHDMISQFCGSTNALITMLGATNLIYDKKHYSFRFKFKMCRKANCCVLTYNEGQDLYEMQFYKMSKTADFKRVEMFEGLYCDMLKETFENFTGLVLTIPRIRYEL
jgi:hypothetical protein